MGLSRGLALSAPGPSTGVPAARRWSIVLLAGLFAGAVLWMERTSGKGAKA